MHQYVDGTHPAAVTEAMTIRPILIAPDPRLKATCTPVEKVDDSVRNLMNDLVETMIEADGIGLAAPQIGVTQRVVVVGALRGDDDDDPDTGRTRKPLKMANPEIVWASDETVPGSEGCLSLPEHYAEVQRPARVRVRYRDEHDEVREIEASDLFGVCIQHEMDHLDGVLFVDHLTSLKRNIILRKLTKLKRQNAAS